MTAKDFAVFDSDSHVFGLSYPIASQLMTAATAAGHVHDRIGSSRKQRLATQSAVAQR